MNNFLKTAQVATIIIFGIITLNTYGQNIIKPAPQIQYQKFAKSKTYVVRYDDPFSGFNETIQNAMQTDWHITPWQMISWEQFEQQQKDENASFIFLSEAMAGNNKNLTFNILNFVMGSKTGNLDKMPELGSIPLSYVDEENEDDLEETYLYKFPVFLRFMQYFATQNLEQANIDFESLVKQNSARLANSQLWLLTDELDQDVNSESKIAKVYSGKVKIVTVEDIENAIKNKQPDVIILHIVAPINNSSGKCLKFLISVADGAPCYYSISDVSSKKPGKFLAEDFKKLQN